MGVACAGQNLAVASKDPRDRRERYRSKWAGVTTLEGRGPAVRRLTPSQKVPAAWQYSPRFAADDGRHLLY